MLERGVEVDVVGDGERQHRLDLGERDHLPGVGCSHGLFGHALPSRATPWQELVQRALAEVDDGIAGTEAEPPLAARAREGTKALDHRIPSSFSSSTGSKKEQLPTDTNCCRRTRASSSTPASRSRQRRLSGVSETSPSSASSSSNVQAARTFRKP